MCPKTLASGGSLRNGAPPETCALFDGQLIGDCYDSTEPIIALDCGADGVDAEEVPQGKGEVLPFPSNHLWWA